MKIKTTSKTKSRAVKKTYKQTKYFYVGLLGDTHLSFIHRKEKEDLTASELIDKLLAL